MFSFNKLCGKESCEQANQIVTDVAVHGSEWSFRREELCDISQVAAPATTNRLRAERSPEAGRQLNPQYRHRVQCVNGFVFGWFDSNSVHQLCTIRLVARILSFQDREAGSEPVWCTI